MCPLFQDRPTTYLELGVYQGESLGWVGENVLKHPLSKGFGVDPWAPMNKHDAERIEQVRQDCIKRVDGLPISLIQMKSVDYFLSGRAAENGPFDVIYCDASHWAEAVMTDAVLSWQFLKVGGMMIFDDVGMRLRRQRENRIARTVDQFTVCFERCIEVIFHNYQVGLIKTKEFQQDVIDPVEDEGEKERK